MSVGQRTHLLIPKSYPAGIMHVARVSEGKARILLGTYSGDGEREERCSSRGR